MSDDRNRKPRGSRGRRTPATSSDAGSPPRPPGARRGPSSSNARRRVSGQYVGRAHTVPGQGGDEDFSPLASTNGTDDMTGAASAPPPSRPSRFTGSRRRLSSSTVVLVVIVALEVAALGVLGVHLAAGRDQATTVSAIGTYSPPLAVPAGTALVRSRVVAPDTLVVTHWIHADRDVYSVRVQVPQLTGSAPGTIAVSDLVVVSDGRLASVGTLPSGQRPRTYSVPPGTRIYVSYVLTGAIQPRGSLTGAAVAKVTSLGVSTPSVPVMSTTYRVLGSGIVGLSCSQNRPRAVPRRCGRAMASGWHVHLRGVHRDDRVKAWLKLT